MIGSIGCGNINCQAAGYCMCGRTPMAVATKSIIGKHVHTFPEGEHVISMILFRDHLHVATNLSVYFQNKETGKLVRIELQTVAPNA